jgi:GNAT superfamily N-acetyltransferase
MTATEVITYEDALAPHFEALNREWIEAHFVVEENDLAVFRDPRGLIVDPGGEIFFVRAAGRIEGTCAMMPMGPGVFELAKMAVRPSARGRGYGDLLLKAAIDFAARRSARRVYLVSSSTLDSALRLYARHGFVRVPVTDAHGYQRADVQMERKLG